MEESSVRFRFDDCDESIIVRTIVTAADHLCAAADISIALLDALEVPLSEGLSALHAAGIDVAVVGVSDDRLTLDINTRRALPSDTSEIFGPAFDIVGSFFDIDRDGNHHRIALTGSLR